MVSSPSLADITSCLGRLRESLSAIRNLEHALGSIHAGPRIVEGLVAEVLQLRGPMQEDARQLYAALGPPESGDVRALFDFANEQLDLLERVLEPHASSINAKRRLSLERDVQAITPTLVRFIEHVELVADATTKRGVSLPLSELLASRPDHGSSRLLRSLLVYGPVSDAQVILPPRAVIGALSLLAELSISDGVPVLRVSHATPDAVELLVEPLEDQSLLQRTPNLACQIPLLGTLPVSPGVARWVLTRLGATFPTDAATRFLLPLAMR